MKITVLAENITYKDGIDAEHGLSLFIETDKNKILFDMGQTALFARNAEKLGVDLSEVDVAVVSHGHYDHGGGLGKFLELNKKAPVYISEYAFGPYYNGTRKHIGLDFTHACSERLVFTKDVCTIAEGLTLFSCNDKEKRHDLGSLGLLARRNGEFQPDDFRHEQYLLIEENGKKILISGCSHKGIMDIVEWFTPDIIVGGFHYSKLPTDEKLESYAKYLDSFDTHFYTCHCTGVEQYEFMKRYMSRLEYISCGDVIDK